VICCQSASVELVKLVLEDGAEVIVDVCGKGANTQHDCPTLPPPAHPLNAVIITQLDLSHLCGDHMQRKETGVVGRRRCGQLACRERVRLAVVLKAGSMANVAIPTVSSSPAQRNPRTVRRCASSVH
jgi:hypothetical protein